MSNFGFVGIFSVLLYSIIPLIIAYFVIRLAVRHGIESSDVAAMLRAKLKREQRNNHVEENDQSSKYPRRK